MTANAPDLAMWLLSDALHALSPHLPTATELEHLQLFQMQAAEQAEMAECRVLLQRARDAEAVLLATAEVRERWRN